MYIYFRGNNDISGKTKSPSQHNYKMCYREAAMEHRGSDQVFRRETEGQSTNQRGQRHRQKRQCAASGNIKLVKSK